MLVNLMLLGGVVLLLLGIVIDRRTRRKIQSMREAGVYPQDGHESAGDVDRLLHLGHKIEAIKVYRRLHPVGLREAKAAVEKRQGEIGLG